jgi:hypothetical protein
MVGDDRNDFGVVALDWVLGRLFFLSTASLVAVAPTSRKSGETLGRSSQEPSQNPTWVRVGNPTLCEERKGWGTLRTVCPRVSWWVRRSSR